MLAEERRAQVLALLDSKGTVTVSELSQFFNVTPETIRRDLDTLNGKKLLKRIHGGAVVTENKLEIPFEIRKQTNIKAKEQIAAKAARLVKPGDVIFLDISSTAAFLAKRLSEMKDLTVITNSIIIAFQFADKQDINLIQTGGILRPNSYSLVGPLANKGVRNYRADKFFCSCRGFSVQHGISDSNELESEVKKTMVEQSSQSYLIMDHTKINEIGLIQLATIDQVKTIICDNSISDDEARKIRQAGVHLI